MKITVEIVDSLFADARRFAASQDVALDELIGRALRDFISADRSATPFQLRKYSFAGDGMLEKFSWPAIRDEIYRGRGA